MPHIVMEYSQELAQPLAEAKLLAGLHAQVVDSGLFSPQAVKARSIAYEDYVLPEGADAFVHITCSILSGRKADARETLSEALFACAKAALPEGVKLSVNIHEMDAHTYVK